MRPNLREAIQEQFAHRCGYCGVHEDAMGARLTVDHFQPVSHGGTDDLVNLVYACHACNEFKSDFWPTDPERALLHPLRDDLTLHIVESITHVLVPITVRGRDYINVTRLNRPELIERRRRDHNNRMRQEAIEELLRRFSQLEAEVKQLRDRLNP